MATQNTNRRLSPVIIKQDLDAYNGLKTILDYQTHREEATAENIQEVYETMLAKQRDETEKQVLFKNASDMARLSEWEFHNRILAMKEAVRGQYGSDSNEASAVGFKKKSERKRPTKK
jgi:hypothetical protein